MSLIPIIEFLWAKFNFADIFFWLDVAKNLKSKFAEVNFHELKLREKTNKPFRKM